MQPFKIIGNVYFVGTYQGSCHIIDTGDGLIMIDPGYSDAFYLIIHSMHTLGLNPTDVKYIINTHWHWDHSFGMCAWDVPTIASRMTNDKLKIVQSWAWDDASMDDRVERKEDIVFCNEMIRREYPDRSQISVATADIVFEGRITLDLGGITCDLIHAGGPHTSDGVICHIPSEKFIFLGDGNSRDLYGHPWHFDIAHEEDMVTEMMKIPYDRELVEPYVRLLDELDFTHCIGGHADVMTKQELFDSFA